MQEGESYENWSDRSRTARRPLSKETSPVRARGQGSEQARARIFEGIRVAGWDDSFDFGGCRYEVGTDHYRASFQEQRKPAKAPLQGPARLHDHRGCLELPPLQEGWANP